MEKQLEWSIFYVTQIVTNYLLKHFIYSFFSLRVYHFCDEIGITCGVVYKCHAVPTMFARPVDYVCIYEQLF